MKNRKSKRQAWKKPWDFIFTAAGLTIGLGNIWRFPYLCFYNGGGAFLIPYVFFVVFVGLPLIILEISVGQRFRRGLSNSWGLIPIAKGIAFAQCVIILHSSISYPILLMWALKYLVHSFSWPLPWSHCNNAWNTIQCVSPNVTIHVERTNASYENETSVVRTKNGSVSAGREYWNYEVLRISSGIEEIGNIKGDLVLYLFIIWIGTYLCTFKGIKWTAKIVYFTATIPFVLITIILVRGVSLEGAGNGLKYYLVPNMTKLKEPEVWVSAGTQVLYSYGTASGSYTTLGSFNSYHQNFVRDAIAIAFLNLVTSFLSGFGVFSALGFMAIYQNTTVPEVARSGPGLAFVAYPETLSLLPLPQLWCAIFFLTLLLLGFDSQFVYLECFTTFIFDKVPRIRSIRYHREIFQGVLCVFMFIGGIMMATDGGVYIFEIYNNFGVAGWCLFFIATCECLVIGWIYGASRHWLELKKMIGETCGRAWLIASWKFFAPCICSAVTVYYLCGQTALKYNDYIYPAWAQAIAYLMSASSIAMIPGYAIYKIIKARKDGKSVRQLLLRRDAKSDLKTDIELDELYSEANNHLRN